MTTFNKAQTALFRADGDFWLAVSNGDDIDEKLSDLIDAADGVTPESLFGTMPDSTVVNIGTSPRRPRRPA